MFRRGFLKRSGALFLSSMLPRPGRASLPGSSQTEDSGDSHVTERLSSYMADARTLVLPSRVIECAQQHILDTIASMISGANLPPGRIALVFAQQCRGGEGTIVG